MPGVLIDEMPFMLDPMSSPSSSSPSSASYFYDSSASSSPQQYFNPFISSGISCDSSSPGLTFGDFMDHQSAAAAAAAAMQGEYHHRGYHGSAKELLLEAAAMVAAAAAATSQPGSIPGETQVAAALQRFLPSNSNDEAGWSAEDVYSCDEFRMFEFKVRRCMRGRSHDWTECPFAHPGEKARRRDPRRFHYSGTACPDFRKGSCKHGDSCELAHGVFECWLHPARYRTQPCKDGRTCKRRVCFFAHTPEQLRVLSTSPSSASSPSPSLSSSACSSRSAAAHQSQQNQQFQQQQQQQQLKNRAVASSPTSTLVGIATSPPPLSPPLSPSDSPPHSPIGPGRYTSVSGGSRMMAAAEQQRRLSFNATSSPPGSPMAAVHHHSTFTSPCSLPKTSAMSDLVSALHQLELNKQAAAAASWMGQYSTGPSPLRPGSGAATMAPSARSISLPCTPTKPRWDCGGLWEMEVGDDDEEEALATPPRVETGRDLRARIYGRMASRKMEGATIGTTSGNTVGFSDDDHGFNNAAEAASPDLDWVNQLLVTE